MMKTLALMVVCQVALAFDFSNGAGGTGRQAL